MKPPTLILTDEDGNKYIVDKSDAKCIPWQDEFIELIENSQNISAIKLLRSNGNMGLKDAKLLVDIISAKMAFLTHGF